MPFPVNVPSPNRSWYTSETAVVYGSTPGMPGVDGGEPRLACARERHAHARLQNAVASHDATALGVVLGAIQRMRDRADERRCRTARQHGVGVERDDVANAAQPWQVAFRDRERVIVRAADERIEVDELSALSLPPHPHVVGRVPSAAADAAGRMANRLAWRHPSPSRSPYAAFSARIPSTAAATIASSPGDVSVGESRKSLSNANRICGSRLARYCTSRWLERARDGVDAAEEQRHDDGRSIALRDRVLVVEPRESRRGARRAFTS